MYYHSCNSCINIVTFLKVRGRVEVPATEFTKTKGEKDEILLVNNTMATRF